MVSVWVHPLAVGAGASGAIFGLYGAVFGFLLMNRRTLNPAVISSIGKSAGIFVLYNVVYGSMSGTTDLSAHLGGLLAGFLAGIVLVRPPAHRLLSFPVRQTPPPAQRSPSHPRSHASAIVIL